MGSAGLPTFANADKGTSLDHTESRRYSSHIWRTRSMIAARTARTAGGCRAVRREEGGGGMNGEDEKEEGCV